MRICQQVLGSIDLHQVPGVHDCHALPKLQCLILIMRHVQPRELVFGVQTRNICPNTCAQFLIDTRQRLIEKDHRCFADEGARNTHTLRLPA